MDHQDNIAEGWPRWFSSGMILITLAPFAVLPLLFADSYHPGDGFSPHLSLLLIANLHISITALFFSIKDYEPILMANKRRYFFLPLATVFSLIGLHIFLPKTYHIWIWVVFSAWQNWHFGRQNMGIHSFISRAEGFKAPSTTENLLIGVGIVCGILAFYPLAFPTDNNAFPFFVMIKEWSLFLFGFVSVSGLILIIVQRQHFNFRKASFFMTSIMFFGVLYISNKPAIAFWTFGLSHALQYITFMTIIGFRSQHRFVKKTAICGGRFATFLFSGLFMLMVLGGLGLTIQSELGTWLGQHFTTWGAHAVTGLFMGVVVSHFLIDADAWRLRHKPQRKIIFDKFSFALGRSS